MEFHALMAELNTQTPANPELRDWFAVQAMRILLIDAITHGTPPNAVATDAYAMADAMLDARSAP